MLYKNICRSPPMTERPATAPLTPNETAAPLVLVAEAELPVVVPVVPPMLVASAVVLQVYVPWMILEVCSESKVLQSIWAVDWTLKPPLTLLRAGSNGVEKLPEKSIAPPTVVKAGKSIPVRAVLLAIWKAPPTVARSGMDMLASLALATKA